MGGPGLQGFLLGLLEQLVARRAADHALLDQQLDQVDGQVLRRQRFGRGLRLGEGWAAADGDAKGGGEPARQSLRLDAAHAQSLLRYLSRPQRLTPGGPGWLRAVEISLSRAAARRGGACPRGR